jgi:hypothetical protein
MPFPDALKPHAAAECRLTSVRSTAQPIGPVSQSIRVNNTTSQISFLRS